MTKLISLLISFLAALGLGELVRKVAPNQAASVLPAESPKTMPDILKFLGLVAVGSFLWKFIGRILKVPPRFRTIALIINVLALALLPTILGHAGLCAAFLIGTAAGGIGTAFQFNLYELPEYIYWNDGGNPINFMVIETAEDGVLHDWLAAAIAAMNGYGNVGALAANDVKMLVASGRIPNKQVTIRGTTSAVGAINFFGGYDNLGVLPYKTSNLNILANNPTYQDNFFALFLPNLVTLTDRVEVTYSDGTQCTYDSAELQAKSVEFQDAPAVVLNNINRLITKVQIVSALGGAAYVFKAAMPGQP